MTPEPADLAPSPAAGEEEPSRPYVYEAFRPPAPIAETLSKVSGDGESALVPRISYDFNSPGGVDVYWDEFGEAKLVDGTYEVSVMTGVGQGALGGSEFGGSYAEFFPLVDIYLQIETWSHGLGDNASGLRFREQEAGRGPSLTTPRSGSRPTDRTARSGARQRVRRSLSGI